MSIRVAGLSAFLAASCLAPRGLAADAPAARWPAWDAADLAARLHPAKGAVAMSKEAAAPVLARADVLVVDGPLAGCVAARRIAAQGRKVILASTGTSLPREMLTCLRLWSAEAALAALPQDLAPVLAPCVRSREGGEAIFHAAKLAQAMEDMVLDAGVGLYYDLRPCGVARSGRRVTAVLFACKAGLVAIEAGAVLDCTPDGALAMLAEAEHAARKPAGGAVEVSYTMLCDSPMPEAALAAEGVPELVDGKVLAHGALAEFRMRLPGGEGVFQASALGLQARRVAAAAGRALRRSGAWKDAAFVRGGDEVLVEPTRRIAGRSAGGKLNTDACRAKGLDNLIVCSPAADVDDAAARDLLDPLKGLALADAAVAADWATLCRPADDPTPATVHVTLPGAAAGEAVAAGEARFAGIEPIYRTDAEVPLRDAKAPVVATCDVLVVGGGTSGMPAALAGARRGRSTILIEKHGDVGGTHTIGGVSAYWFGRPTDFHTRLDGEASAFMRAAGMPKCMGMLDLLMRAGVRVVPNCLVVGAIADGAKVTGAVVATPAGLVAVRAKAVIDATGDGDLAARAGAETRWGTGRDALTLWYSFGMFKGARAEASRNFDSSVDLRDPADTSRAMVTCRRRRGIFGEGDFPQVYLAPRETRHVLGRSTVTYADILAERRCRDVVVVARSNFDIKGIADSDLAQCGYAEVEFRKNYTAWIPYSALLPARLEGLLVVGKAYSVTHDALGLARMQRDLMAMGGAAGLAAAMACQADGTFSVVDVARLQTGLVELGVLSQSHLDELPPADGPTWPPLAAEDLRQLVAELKAGTPSLSAEVKLLVRGEAARPLLKEALADAAGTGKLRVARALCFLGDPAGADVLLEELTRQLAADSLPKSPQKAHDVPDHGYAPEPAFLINTLGRLGDRRVLPLLAPLAGRIRMNLKRSDDMFQYVFSICYATERLGEPAGCEALNVLADKPGIRGGLIPVGTDPRKSVDFTAERYAYLELCVGRALARCGSRRGYEIVIGYLNDYRGFLARSAHEELVDLSRQRFGYSLEKWRSWLAAAPSPLPPQPYRKRIE